MNSVKRIKEIYQDLIVLEALYEIVTGRNAAGHIRKMGRKDLLNQGSKYQVGPWTSESKVTED
jgi:hypothetical protein